jgi:hypothetical protein
MTSPRRSGTITRANCIFVGSLAVISFPPILVLLLTGLSGVKLMAIAVVTLPFSVLAGLFLTPLGVLGGWLFWLVGVQPAKRPMTGVERVFE